MFPILEVKLKNDTELATQKNSQVKMASVQSGNLGVAELKEEVQALQEENDFYRSELLRIRSKLERMGNDSSPELVLRDMISPSWLPPTRSFIDVDGVSVITDIKRKVPGRKRKLLKNIYRNIIPLTATVGFAIARGKGLGVVAKVGAAILGTKISFFICNYRRKCQSQTNLRYHQGGMAGVLAKMSRSAYKKMASSPSLVKWAPIGIWRYTRTTFKRTNQNQSNHNCISSNWNLQTLSPQRFAGYVQPRRRGHICRTFRGRKSSSILRPGGRTLRSVLLSQAFQSGSRWSRCRYDF